MAYQWQEGMFKKAPCLTRPARARQDVPFLGQGRERRWRTFSIFPTQLFLLPDDAPYRAADDNTNNPITRLLVSPRPRVGEEVEAGIHHKPHH